MKQIILYDLDDTLCDSRHRTTYDSDGKSIIEDWVKNSTPQKTHLDNLIYPMTKILMYTLAHKDCINVCITSRQLHNSDIEFFQKHDIIFDKYLHRGCVHKEYREMSSSELKNMLLSVYLKDCTDIPKIGFDDLECNLEVFRKHGFLTYNAKDINQSKIKADNVIHEIAIKLNLT